MRDMPQGKNVGVMSVVNVKNNDNNKRNDNDNSNNKERIIMMMIIIIMIMIITIKKILKIIPPTLKINCLV